MSQKYPLIAKEGWPFIGLAFVIALAATFFTSPWWVYFPLWLIFIFNVQFFRDPTRNVTASENDIVSPADGKVIVVETTQDPYLKRDAIRISVFMNVFNVHSNRSPYDGVVSLREYHGGAFFNAALDKAAEQNERNALVLQTARGDITFVQIAGLIARRILCYVDKGSTLEKGQRYGFIRFGSRVDLYFPVNVDVKVSIGDTVYAALTTLATFPSETK